MGYERRLLERDNKRVHDDMHGRQWILKEHVTPKERGKQQVRGGIQQPVRGERIELGPSERIELGPSKMVGRLRCTWLVELRRWEPRKP